MSHLRPVPWVSEDVLWGSEGSRLADVHVASRKNRINEMCKEELTREIGETQNGTECEYGN